jgi:hypothetical protein
VIRRLAGAITLGLPAALLAHTIAFGNDHTMGGSYAQLLSVLGVTAVVALTILWLGLCASMRDRLVDGSVLRATAVRFFPSTAGLAIAAGGWFGLAESLEASHDSVSIAVVLAALFFAALIIRAFAMHTLCVLAKAIVATASQRFDIRNVALVAVRQETPAYGGNERVPQLYSRPPPNRFYR